MVAALVKAFANIRENLSERELAELVRTGAIDLTEVTGFGVDVARTVPNARLVSRTLTKKMGSPEDVARAVIFFCEATDFATGATLALDGGRLLV